MKIEFNKFDVLAEIGNAQILLIVVDRMGEGYLVDTYWDNRYHESGMWVSFELASTDMVKVDEWDVNASKMKGVCDVEP